MQTAIVTGASRGLGLALTAALSQRGWRVIVDARDGEALAAAVAGLDNVVPVPGDIRDPEHRAALARTAGERVDALVNNASTLGPRVGGPLLPLSRYPLAELERVYAVNVLAPLALAQLVLPLMPDGAALLNISSDAAREPYAGWGGYGPSKAALDQITAILAAEDPVLRVYAVDPGDMRTQLHQEAFPGEDISDRPLPDVAVPGLLALIEGDVASGRHRAQEIVVPV